jgi:tetratricopeptide (TPR) repeat protein
MLLTLSAPIAEAQFLFKKKESTDPIEQKNVGVEDLEAKRKAELYHTEAEKYFILEDYPKAFVLYQKSIEFDPNNATAFFKIAEIYTKSEDYDKAAENANKAIALNPENKFYYLAAAEAYTKKSDFAQAATTYEQMLANCENTDEYLFDLGALYIYQEKYDEALKVYNRIEDKYGINDQVVFQKQKLHLRKSDLDMAVEEGENLIENFPGESQYVLALADILISNGEEDRAVPYLEELLKDNPGESRATLMLSDIYRKKGDTEKADILLIKAFGDPELDLKQKMQVMAGFMQQLPGEQVESLTKSLGERLIQAHPNQPDAYSIYGDLMFQLQDAAQARAQYLKAIELGASGYNIWQNTLQLDVQLGDFDLAIAHGEKALELYPNQSSICWFLGTAYLMKKQHDDAIAVLEQGKKLSGSNPQMKSLFNAQLGDAYNNVEEYKKSDAAYDAALTHDPDNDHVLNNYSYFLSLRKERLDLADKMSKKLVASNPDDPTYLDTRAWVLYVMGRYDEAKTYIERAIESNSDKISGTIIEHYGDILFKLGDIDSAVKQWQRAKGMDETTELIDKKIADRKLYE